MRFLADCAPRGKRRSAHYTSYSVAVAAFLCLIPLSAAAQGTLEGTVRHAGTGAALPGAQVGLAELSLGGTTGLNGRYEVGDIPAGIHTIHIQLIGYATEVREVSVEDGRTTHLDMELHETAVALEGLVAVGSRARPRTVTQSSVPIDAISSQDFIDQGDTDVNDLLRTVIPSFNVNPQATGDAAKIVRPASLRGLAPDHTLVLVNGKRRHRAAVITWIGGGFADGAQGPDLSSIPAIALRQVEILRDGASAQYGSDAIAGVVNLALRDEPSGGRVEVRTGTFWEGDGESYTVAGNIGLPLGEAGFVNLSAEFGESNPTSRSVQRDDAAALIAAGNTHVGDPAQIWGAPTIDNDLKLWANFGRFLGDGLQIYGHANYASETVTGGFFFRNPNTRAGVFSLDSGETLLGRVLDDPNCFTFQEMFPGGFTPQFGGDASDASLVVGLRGHTHGGLLWDVSGSFGQNAVDFFIDNTVNASLGPQSPASFDPGIYMQREIGANLDLNYTVNDMVNVAGGAEFRDEYFEIGIGETASWEIGSFAPQGFSAGSNGFPGFSDIAAGGWHRVNYAVYGDVELRGPNDRWTVGTALRTERFEDFGTTANGKLAVRYALTDILAVRGSASTGFRAQVTARNHITSIRTARSAILAVGSHLIPPYRNSEKTVSNGGKSFGRSERTAASRHRLQASPPGSPRLKSTSNPGPAACPEASAATWVADARSRRMPRICPVRGLRRIAIGRLLAPSKVNEPPGPVSVMLAKLSGQSGRTGRTKAKLELPSPSAVSGMAKRSEKSLLASAVRPVTANAPAESGSAGGASTTNAGFRNGTLSEVVPPHSRSACSAAVTAGAAGGPSSHNR